VKVVELLVLFVDCSSSSNIDEKGGENNDPEQLSVKKIRSCIFFAKKTSSVEFPIENNLPDGTIERSNTEDIPLSCDPAPNSGITICSESVLVLKEDVYKGRNKRNTVTAKQVGYLHSSQFSSVIFVIKCQIDIERHG
jgi:hypothetical protein